MRPDHIVLARLLDVPRPYAGAFAWLPAEVLAMRPIEGLPVQFGPECMADGSTSPDLQILLDIFTSPPQTLGLRPGMIVMVSGRLESAPVKGLHGAVVVPWGSETEN